MRKERMDGEEEEEEEEEEEKVEDKEGKERESVCVVDGVRVKVRVK
jgi:hypothetical protein